MLSTVTLLWCYHVRWRCINLDVKSDNMTVAIHKKRDWRHQRGSQNS